ncbi:Protein POOR HOMOLOGOUS SYNAPSIS 1 [Bienertia sinuspersici]
MAGALVDTEPEKAAKPIMVMRNENLDHWQWRIQFARCFTYPTYHSNSITTTTTLIPLKRSIFKPVWISSSGPSIVSLHPSADDASSGDSILTVSLQGTVLEEHFISTLQFTWPQVSCLSEFPTRGSLVVLASYVDSSDEVGYTFELLSALMAKQKFAMRFPRASDVEDFITSLKDILSNKIPNGRPAVDVLPAISSQSEYVPPYRPDTSILKNAISPKNLQNEDHQDSLTQDIVANSQGNVEAFPPRFTSLVSSCSAELEQGKLAMALSDRPQDADLKAQISKYMQDASFLDIVNKVNEVITELGGEFVM